MALTNEQIKEAVLALDVNNDANWKADGMPKVPVLKQAIGAGSGELSQALVLGSFGLSTQAPYDIRNMILENAAQESTPEKQDDAPAETPAENGDGESTADADKYAEKTRADADTYSQTTRANADKYYQERKEQADKEYKTTMENAKKDADALRDGAETGAAQAAQEAETPAEPVILENRVLVKCVADSCGVNGNGENPDIDTLKRDDIAWITESIAEALGIDGSNQLMVIADPSDQVLERARNKKDLISA